jgi:2-polyprenyl-3-methyl-5-hydroxy-6-metoxy-1,4-benzoquinol methylase
MKKEFNFAGLWRWRLAQATEWRWWRFYLRRRAPRSYLAAKNTYWHGLLTKSALWPPPGARVLDAGCGPAGVFMALDQQHVDALDPLLERYARHLPHFRQERYPWVTFHTQMLEQLDAKAPYDWVFCCNAINHVADWSLGLDKLAAATRAGGTLVLTVDAHRWRWAQYLFQIIPGDILHPHQHLPEEYRRALLERGLQLTQIERLKRGGLFDHYLLVARKPWLSAPA